MAEIPEFPMIDEQAAAEEQLAELLEAMAEASGIPLEEIMASEFEEPREEEPEFREGEIGAEELEEAREAFTIENEYGRDSDDYLDGLMDDLDVDPSDETAYSDEGV